ncbi:glycosyltransferase [Mangrovibacterium sp.]|uniref:glycosyltransferase n=1 Tax=Mangrovibacterium sp. TaxID=1961364 RepID=UPI00356A1728
MNILLITQLFPADSAARYSSGALREFALEWEKAGHCVQVIRPHFAYEKEPFREKPFIIGRNIQVEFIQPKRVPLVKWTFYSYAKLRKKLQFAPDVVVCHLYNSYFTFSGLARQLKVPFVIGIHMSDIKIAKNWFHRFHQQMVFRQASGFACRSQSYEKQFSEIFPSHADKTFLAQSGIPPDYLKMKTTSEDSPITRIITVSRLEKRKQIDRVIRALKELSVESDWHYTIVGEGGEKDELKRLTNELDLNEHVHFAGALPRAEVMEQLQQHEVFVLPSYQETFGLVYLEAMAAGCLVIGSRNEGIDGIIQDGENGFLCDAAIQESIQAKLMEAISLDADGRKRIHQRAEQTIENFTLENKANEYLNHLKKLVDRSSAVS